MLRKRNVDGCPANHPPACLPRFIILISRVFNWKTWLKKAKCHRQQHKNRSICLGSAAHTPLDETKNKSAAGIAWCPATALTSSEVTVLNLCTSSSHALYCTKFWEIIWNDIKVIEWTWFLYWKFQREIILQKDTIAILTIYKITKWHKTEKTVEGVTVHNQSLVILYLYQVLWNYLEQYQSYRADTISTLKITKGNNSAKNVGGATVVNLCMSSGHALYLCQVSWNNIKRYQSYRVSTISIRKITKGNNSVKNAGGATVVNLCTSSDHALYFYQVL